ncbi:siderophore-interacting protein [Glutamicibacter halophytocola]|nr:siderophore-interacting protein [Glutamicibacter halophytocola]
MAGRGTENLHCPLRPSGRQAKLPQHTSASESLVTPNIAGASHHQDQPMEIFEATVQSTHHLSPTLKRLRFGVHGFTSTGIGDEYVRLFFPHTKDRNLLSLPVADGDSWRTVEGQPDAPMRTYTIREAGDGWIEIDFVVHDGGIAAAWALDAQVGDRIGLNSPTGLYECPPDATSQVLICDLTGLPAAVRIAELSDARMRTELVVEIPDDSSRLDLSHVPQLVVQWIVAGNGVAPSVLPQVARKAVEQLVDGEPRPYVWVAGQSAALREIRKMLHRELRWPNTQYKVIGYWVEQAEKWRERWDALDASTKSSLDALWDSFEDKDEALIAYESELARLGL